MACAPGFPLRLPPLERLWRGLERRNPPPGSLLAVGWKLFASLLAVSPRARSGNNRLSRSRGNRHGRLGGNSLGGEGEHFALNITQEGGWGKGIKRESGIVLEELRTYGDDAIEEGEGTKGWF
jgi:hypothetical protein